jgi:adenosine deaminase
MDRKTLQELPKALLHDHLDGGLRVETVIDLAETSGYSGLPVTDADSLATWFFQGGSDSLEQYLDAFEHTVGVCGRQEALRRVAYEAGEDLAADGVVYAEVRFGPSLHGHDGMSREAAIEAVLDGFAAASRDHGIVLSTIVSALRQDTDSVEVARAGARYRDEGVVGFDLAGPEAGFPADNHLAACLIAREAGLGLTIHAGEGDGPNSIWLALARCGAQRIGHGVRIVEDTKRAEDGSITELGSLARRVRDHRITLEVSPSSNLHIGAYPDAESHPFSALLRAGFAVTINTDNRLMSNVSLTDEFALMAETFDLTAAELEMTTETALVGGFGDWTTRRRLLEEVVRPAYASLG